MSHDPIAHGSLLAQVAPSKLDMGLQATQVTVQPDCEKQAAESIPTGADHADIQIGSLHPICVRPPQAKLRATSIDAAVGLLHGQRTGWLNPLFGAKRR
jgi:hypothetical protein